MWNARCNVPCEQRPSGGARVGPTQELRDVGTCMYLVGLCFETWNILVLAFSLALLDM
jgi:hypothetical protein